MSNQKTCIKGPVQFKWTRPDTVQPNKIKNYFFRYSSGPICRLRRRPNNYVRNNKFWVHSSPHRCLVDTWQVVIDLVSHIHYWFFLRIRFHLLVDYKSAKVYWALSKVQYTDATLQHTYCDYLNPRTNWTLPLDLRLKVLVWSYMFCVSTCIVLSWLHCLVYINEVS